MIAKTGQMNRVMYGLQGADSRRVIEAKFKLAPLGYAYGFFDRIHYWSFPAECQTQCVEILRSVFPNTDIYRLN
jgi:hypothetical protein